MKKATILLLSILISGSVMAQLQRSIPPCAQAPAQPVPQQKETFGAIRASVIQNFETYTDFSLIMNPWTTLDVDGYQTYGITDVTFPHSGEAMSYIVFNPLSTTPSLIEDPALLPHGGYKYAACFASLTHPNNDWIFSPLIELGTNGRLKFWVKSYTSNYGLERYKVGVSTTNTNPASFTIISGGGYLEAPADAWVQKEFDLSAYSGMDIYVGIQCVSDNAFIFMVDDIEVTSVLPGNSTLTGKVTDAVNGNPVANAQVSIAGLSDNSDESGNFSIANIPAGVMYGNFTATPLQGDAPLSVQFTDLTTEGTHTVTASATGYTNYTNSQVSIPNNGTLDLQIALSPTLSEDQYRFVLTWGETPPDLDSHLKTPDIEGSAYHVYYENQGSADSPPFAILDIDDQLGYGPETTTIYDLRPGEYHYYIHNHSGTPEINTSNAVVQIYNKDGLKRTIQVPTKGTGLFWDVCTLNGSNGNISVINQITDSEPGGLPKLTPDQQAKKPAPDVNRGLNSWSWDFGDGGSSTSQNPSHTYTTNGTYTVSLVVSDGLNNEVETKSSFITVGPLGEDESVWEKEISIYPNPARDHLQINTSIQVKSMSLMDLKGRLLLKNDDPGFNHSLNLGNLQEGVYILVIMTEQGNVQKKLEIKR